MGREVERQLACPDDAFYLWSFLGRRNEDLGSRGSTCKHWKPISPSTLDPAKNWNACLVKRARGSVHLSTNFHDIAYTRNTYVQKVYTRFQTSFWWLERTGYAILSENDEKMFFESNLWKLELSNSRDVREYF